MCPKQPSMIYLALYELIGSTQSNLIEDITLAKPRISSTKASSVLQFTIPDGKLFYPEPFIASPSYLHADLTYLHIFQYWYWLWFMFIFLICFFFISFLSTIRWCTLRVRPRRETRGVSRSKCGDLITACVPVSWAISIIVNESTDATDLNDGFGTAELVVGVRAYQWGWEYYYPKSIDLNYNVKPSYSAFIGNSLKYHSSSSKVNTSNSLWRMYQNKSEDRVVTPSHLLLLPLDSGNMANFMNFKNIGLNTLEESSAFAKIRNATKVYNSHLVHTPTTFTNKYYTLNTLFLDENSYLNSASFGVKKQHNLLSVGALGNSFNSTILDEKSFGQFLAFNTSATSQTPSNSPSPLSLVKEEVLPTTVSAGRLSQSVSQGFVDSSSTLTRLSNYPALLDHINDDSDKEGLSHPSFKVSSPVILQPKLSNAAFTFSRSQPSDLSSNTTRFDDLTLTNAPTNTRVFNLDGPNSKILLGDQSIRNFPSMTPHSSNLNLSTRTSPEASNLTLSQRLNKSLSPYSTVLDSASGYVDSSLFAKTASSRTFTAVTHPAVHSTTDQQLSSLEFDSTDNKSTKFGYGLKGELVYNQVTKKTPVGDIFVGSREKTPRSINTSYWATFWSTTNPNHRVNASLKANFDRSHFYLPTFTNYADYDFRNDQAIDMLEELFWENNYSSYNFYDYMTLSKNSVTGETVSPRESSLVKQFHNFTFGTESTDITFASKPLKDLTLLGSVYANSVQMEDYPTTPTLLTTQNFALLPAYGETNEFEDSFRGFKGLVGLVDKSSNLLVGSTTSQLAPRSYLSVFNNFRSDLDDFAWNRLLMEQSASLSPLGLPLSDDLNFASLGEFSDLTVFNDASNAGSDLRLSNPATLRSSVRNSIVNYNAFQKVFKPRLDESRAHVNSASFADSGLKQPFLSDSKVPYLQLLGKNRDSFYETPLYSTSTHSNFNLSSSLSEALNTPMYDFPFLLARTSDTMRFTWVDWFSKWKHIEVQPSSVSKYSTIGVPYLRKPFDFNSTTGDKFQETELYFTRVSRSRRNFLTNWSYSPYMHNRSYIWNFTPDFESVFLVTNHSLSSAKTVCNSMTWYWSAPAFYSNSSSTTNYSSSGNDVYAKSTWRPKVGIQSYYYKVSKLVDLLSKRESLYRKYLESSSGLVQIPSSVCATPNNRLLQELKSSLLFTDPANYSSEYSRDLLYTASPYFKFAYLQSLVRSANLSALSLPLNPKLLTNYALFYFFSADSQDLGRNSELLKSQYRPLKKGISSMLRLHATGAVAMPIEIRLQVLASSRDVIHSWAIPSASVKIDCVPGYTSHRMMKFLLTGVYWGQCQEICGRYHHWMPIVVYFMKRDLFFLWCTHFVFAPSPSETWDISDRRFADFIRFASYDKSSWLNEFGSN